MKILDFIQRHIRTLISSLAIALAFNAATASANFPATTATSSFDVVVYGATPAGIAASVAAGREGKSVALIEPLPLAGGIMSGGLSFSDSNQMARETLGGIFEEFHLNVEKYYTDRGTTLPYSVRKKDNKPWTYEPHVAEKIFWELLNGADIEVFLNETLADAQCENNSIKSIRTSSGKSFAGKVFIDTSYEGDLMAAAGVTYRVGRESRNQHDESLAGARYPKKVVDVSPYGEDGKPLPFITSTAKPAEGEGDNKIMTYSFRFCLTTDPANRVPFTRPSDYDPARYELFRRYLKKYPDTKRIFDLYPIPGNKKFDGNNGIGLQLSIGLVGENAGYPDGTAQERQAIWDAHRSFCEGLFYFLMTDPAVPAKIQDRVNRLGYAKDEFAKFGHFPPVLYVREARRMVGDYFMTQADILDDVKKPDSIGVGSFPVDSHDCQRIAVGDNQFINEGTIYPARLKTRKIGQPYQVPYRAITPKADECTNLLVPVCLSSSHVAFSSIRVEPAWIVLGQSAGIAAALAIEEQATVQDIKYQELAPRLKKQNQVLDLPAGF